MANRGTAKRRTKARKEAQRGKARRVLLEHVARECGGRRVESWSDQQLSTFIQMKRPSLRAAVEAARATPGYVEKLKAAGGVNSHFLLALAGEG